MIDNALREKSDIHILYRNLNGQINDRIITPLEWVTPYKLRAFCHLREDERHFLLGNIITIEYSDPAGEYSPGPQISSKPMNEQIAPIIIQPSTNQTISDRSTPKKTFSRIESAENWQSLLEYYIECLNFEYQQQFTFYARDLFRLNLDPDTVYKFFSGQYQLNFSNLSKSEEFIDFINPRERPNQQLCLGKSFIIYDDEKISPLLFVPITIKGNIRSNFFFQAEEVSFSYAALSRLHFDPDEIADFLHSYEDFIVSQPPFSEIEAYIFNMLKEKISFFSSSFDEQEFTQLTPVFKLLESPGLFWVNNIMTGNLIDDLFRIKNPETWLNKSASIESLFYHYPEHVHHSAPDFINDQSFFVTDINNNQRKAVLAVSEYPVTIITGPPGTGKSQLVLNLIAQAYNEGQSVLFASHNNQAVNVVMDRLQDEIRFQGAIRTGRKQYRESAVSQMEEAIQEIIPTDLDYLQHLHHLGKEDLLFADKQLKKIRDLLGKIQSYQQEKDVILGKIPTRLRDKVALFNVSYNETEKTRINNFITEILASLRELINQRQDFISDLQAKFVIPGVHENAFQVILDYELKWGELPIGPLQKDSFLSLSEIYDYCSNWEKAFETLALKKELEMVMKQAQEIKNQIDQNALLLGEENSEIALRLADLDPSFLDRKKIQLVNLSQEFNNIKENNFSLVEKVLITLHLVNPKRKFIKHLNVEMDEISSNGNLFDTNLESFDKIEQHFKEYQLVLQTAELFHQLSQYDSTSNNLKSRLDILFSELPTGFIASFDRINIDAFAHSSHLDLLGEFKKTAKELVDELTHIRQSFNSFFVENDQNLESVIVFQSFDNQYEPVGLFISQTSTNESEMFELTTLIRRTLVIWEANSILQDSLEQLAKLPLEEAALKKYKDANSSLFKSAGDLMRATWQDRASKCSNDVWEGTRKYISAVRQLNELDYGTDPFLWRTLKDAERNNFIFAFQLFPVWALTNLTARTNFPTTPGLFDLVIIDEASQCDIPSVIPLLFRAKKAVIIGDPNQLRHVASLNEMLNKQLGQKYGVGLESFSYRSISFYDLGERSVGQNPGPILLNEHYRSDPRIINFSNEAFYKKKLDIKTDLTQRGFEKNYLNDHGGVSWLNLKGKYERPSGGSGQNLAEFEIIKQIVPKVLTSLDQSGYPSASVGIVTPFRAQENLFRSWIKQMYPNSLRIKSGTAHQFQGDECDVMIFSPVLSDDIPNFTLNWLEHFDNLLNVAITRARVSLIIVGDFDFCYYNCEKRSKYHQLASYVNNRLNGIFTSIDELPFFGAERFEIIGTFLDPSNPESNRTNLIRFVSSCKGYLDWVDKNFTQEIIDLFDDLFEHLPYPDIRSFRLITAEKQLKSSSGNLRPESVASLKSFLDDLGVYFDMRVLPADKLPHDRFLYHQEGVVNMPPFSGAYGSHRYVSEYTPSSSPRDDFEQLWIKGISVVDVF